MAEEWRLVVHYALHSALSLGSQQDYGLNRGELPEVGDTAVAVVKKVSHSFAFVEFKHYGEIYDGAIHISEFTKLGHGYIANLRKIVCKDEEYNVVLQEYSEKYQNWKLGLVVE